MTPCSPTGAGLLAVERTTTTLAATHTHARTLELLSASHCGACSWSSSPEEQKVVILRRRGYRHWCQSQANGEHGASIEGLGTEA
jgi:hypothetical protein